MNLELLIQDLDYRQILKNEFTHRQERNPSYSLRSFARDLNLSPSRLSEVLNGKGDLSSQSLLDVGHRLSIPTEEILAMQAAMVYKNSASAEVKETAAKYLENYTYKNRFSQLTSDTFKILADWYHFAILSAMEMIYYDGSITYLSRVLRLEDQTVQEALDRMIAHNMVRFHDNKYFPTGEIFSTSNDVASDALKESHRQNFDLAKNALTEVDLLLRDITSATICIDMDKLPEAKKMIKEFRRNLSRFLESGKKNAVYNINIQLHPISEIVYEEKQ